MFGLRAEAQPRFRRVSRAASDAQYRNLRHAAFSLSKRAKKSIRKRRNPSQPGQPPTTRSIGGKNLRGAIYTSANKESAIIGPRASWVGDVGQIHEFGGNRRGDKYPRRPFMEPALVESTPRFAADWEGTIGE